MNLKENTHQNNLENFEYVEAGWYSHKFSRSVLC